MRNAKTCLMSLALPLLAFSGHALAQQGPVGTWTTIDDETGAPKSVVEIYEAADGTLAGRVVEVLQSDQGDNPVCSKCSGDRKDQPIEGMEILWGLSANGDAWEGGKILDPSKGKIYSVRIEPVAGGEQLEVRGFMVFPLLALPQPCPRG